MDDLFDRYRPKNIIELNVVPILDMLMSVIFFLLLSTSFIGYTNLQVPPASVSTITSPVVPPPLGAKLLVQQGAGQKYKIILAWKGKAPGEKVFVVNLPPEDLRAQMIEDKVKEALTELKKTYPTEKTLQIGLSALVPYQVLISVMDATRETLPDAVLISYLEVDALAQHY